MVLLVGEFISTILAALGVIFVARMLGSTSYGLVSIAVIPYQIALLFIDFGINQALIRNIAMLKHQRKYGEVRTYFEAGLIFKLVISLVLALIVYVFATFFSNNIYHQKELIPLIQATSIGIIGQAMFSTAVSAFVGYEKMLLRSYINILFSFLKSVTGPLLIYLGYGSMGAILGRIGPVLITGVIGLLVTLIIITRSEPNNREITHFDALVSMLGFGMPLFISLLLMNGRSRILDSLLPLYVSNKIIGNFTATLNFSVLVSFVSVPISTSLFPLFSKFDYKKDKELKRIFRNAIKYAALLVYPVTTTVILLSSHIVSILYSTSYEFAPNMIRLFMITNFLTGFGTTGVGNLLNSQKQTRTTMNIKLIQFIFGVSLGIFLIPKIGALGLLVTKIISPIPGLIYGLKWIQNNFGFSIDWKTSIKMLIICFASYIISNTILASIEFNNWIELIFGASSVFLIYITLIIRFKVLTKNDIENIINILKIKKFSRNIFRVYNFIS
jgi:O-antigen/teichoic acid export membrane protein